MDKLQPLQAKLDQIEKIILRAKSACARSTGQKMATTSRGGEECVYIEEPYAYHASYFGKTDLIGQELLFLDHKPIWGANHFAKLLDKQHISLQKAEEVIAVSRSAAYYQKNRFLGSWEYEVDGYSYNDENSGDVRFFQGMQTIPRR